MKMIVNFDRKKLWIELIALFRLAAPAILTNFVNYGQGITDQIFVGHLSKEYTQEHSLATYISGMGLASTFVAVTYYFANGLIFCYDTTISQAFGAKNFKKIGLELQTGLFIVSIVSIPVGILWFYMDSILITLLGIEDDVAAVIRIAGRILTISLWPSLMYDLLARFANNQGVVQPALYVGIVVLLLNAFFNWLFIYAFKLGYAGSPLATCTSRWISPILLFGLLYRQGLFRRSWFGLRIKEAIAPSQVWNFFKLGLPAAGVIILEVTGFHLSTIFVTMMHNEVFLAAHIAVFSVLFAAFFVPLGVSVGCAQRVGSALGDARKDDAVYSAHVAQVSTFVLSLLVALILIILRHEIPFLLTSDETIVAVAADLLLLVAALHIADAYQVCAMATIRSTGRQVRGFGMNLLAYYIACPAFIALFVYVFDWSIYGVWAGLSLGVWILMGFLIVHNECVINWETEVDRARRAATGLTPLDTLSVVDDVEQNASLLAADVLAHKEENVDDRDSVDDSEHSDNKNSFDNNED